MSLPPVPVQRLSEQRAGSESSAVVRARVISARELQVSRNGMVNSRLGHEQLNELCALDNDCKNLLLAAAERLGLSARSHNNILKLARTIADLAGQDSITVEHLGEAISYRPDIPTGTTC